MVLIRSLLLFLLISTSTKALLAEPVELSDKYQLRYYAKLNEAKKVIEGQGFKNYEVLSTLDKRYLKTFKKLEEVRKAYLPEDISTYHHLTRLNLYIALTEKSQKKLFVGITNLSRKTTAVIVVMSKEEFENINENTLQFILAHEIGHGFKSQEKRYYILNQNQDYKIPRFTSEELITEDDHLLYLLVHTIGLNKSSNTLIPLLYGTSFSKIIQNSFKLLSKKQDESGSKQVDLSEKLGLSDFYRVTEKANLFENDFVIRQSDLPAIKKLHHSIRNISKFIPESREISFDYYVKEFNLSKETVKYLRKYLFVDLQIKNSENENLNMFEILIGALDIYQEKYDKRKQEFSKLIPRIRFYSEENMADEMAYKFMSSRKIDLMDYLPGLVKSLYSNDSLTEKCFKDYISKNIEPPMGALAQLHPSACSRGFSLYKLDEYYN